MSLETTYTNKNVKMTDEYDVVIVGGGTAGAVAAISSARMGVKTLVVEKSGSLGGSQTMGMVTPVMPSIVPGDSGQCSIHLEITKILHEMGHASPSTYNDGTWFDPVYLAFVLEKLATEAGAEILYHTALVDANVSNGKIENIIVHNNDGLTCIKSKTFVDASGDAFLADMAGVELFSGDEKGLNQPVTLRFEVGGVDLIKARQYLKDCGQPVYDTTPGVGTDGRKAPLFRALLNQKCEEGELTKDDISHFQFFSIYGRPNSVAFNCPELGKDSDVTDARFISRKQIEGKKAIIRIFTFCKKYFPGFENSYITAYAPNIGIRESKRIKAKYVLTLNDVMNYEKFDDGIGKSNYPLDVHGYSGEVTGYKKDIEDSERYYEVPYRVMVTDEISNIIVPGRSCGCDFFAQSTVRVQHTCRSMGEAAGIAAGIAVKDNIQLNTVDGRLVRKIMKDRGADL